jgi:hypothetical protein
MVFLSVLSGGAESLVMTGDEKNVQKIVLGTVKELYPSLLSLIESTSAPNQSVQSAFAPRLTGSSSSSSVSSFPHSNFQTLPSPRPSNQSQESKTLFSSTRIHKMFCCHALQIIPWELVIKDCVRYSGLTEFLGLTRARNNLSMEKMNYIIPYYKRTEKTIETEQDERHSWVINTLVSKLSYSRAPIFSKTFCSQSVPLLTSLSLEYEQKWKKIKSEKRKAFKTHKVVLEEVDEGISVLDISANPIDITTAINSAGGKKAIILTFFDLIDSPEIIRYIFSYVPVCSFISLSLATALVYLASLSRFVVSIH